MSLAVTGDVLLHSRLVEAAEEPDGGYDFLPLLEEQQPYIGQADVALCNLETPIGEPPYRGYPRFDVPAQIVSDVAAVGYDGCTTATNHTMDDGVDGVHRTLGTLEEAGLFVTGSYRDEVESASPAIVDVQGIELGVVAATFSLNGLTADTDWRVDTDISGPTLIERGEAVRDAGAEIVVAAVHDGAEYATRPTASQRQLGHDLAEPGAFDFIYMHHTHSVLPIEKHDGTWIVFGLGNSVAQHATPTVLNREGISVQATFAEQDDDTWDVTELAWVPHFLTEDPVRWCPVDAAPLDSGCAAPAAAEASLQRTIETVGAYGAFDDGLVDWVVDD